METTGYVYFFRHIGMKPVKIGMTTTESVMTRFQSLSTYAPYGAEILGTIRTRKPKALESKLHKELDKHRLNGEWFDIDENMIKYIIDREQNHVEKKIKILLDEWLKKQDIAEIEINTKFESFINSVTLIENNKIDQEKIEALLSSFKRPYKATVSEILSADDDDSISRSDLNTYLNWNYTKDKKSSRYISVITGLNVIGKPFNII